MAGPLGRSYDVERLVAHVRDGRSVLVLGEMGIGKSVTLRHVAAILRADGTRVVSITATRAARNIPFGALTGFVDPHDGSELAVRLDAAIQRLRGRPEQGPVVLFVDDAPFLDDASIAALHHLVTAGDAIVLAAARSSDPVRSELADLWRQADVERVDLDPLDPDDARRLAAELLGDDEEGELATGIATRSGGNPLYLGELVKAHQDGTPTGLTTRLVDLVTHRVSLLGDEAEELLAMVVVGEPLDVSIDAVDTTTLLELEAAQLVTTYDEGGTVVARPSHPIYGEVLRSRLTPLRRRSIAQHLAPALLERPIRRRGDALRLATWLLEAGERPPAALSEAAAFEALGLRDVELADRLAREAVVAERSAGALFALGEVRRLSGLPNDAETLWAEAAERATSDDDIRRVALARGQLHQLFLRQHDRANEILGEAAARIRDPAARLALEADLALARSEQDRQHFLDEVDRVLGDPHCDDESAWTALSDVIWRAATSLDLRRVDEYLRRAEEIEPRLPPERDAEIDLIRALRVNVLFERGQLPAAAAAAEEWTTTAEHRGIASGITAFSSSCIEFVRADPDAARRLAEGALVQLRTYDAFNATPMVVCASAIAIAACGDPDEAEARLGAVEDAGGEGAPWCDVWLPRARAWVAAAVGDVPTAARRALEAGKRGLDAGNVGWGFLALHDAVAWGFAQEALDVMDPHRSHLHGCELFELLHDHAAAAAAADVGALAHCARVFETLDARWPAAAAWANRAAVLGDGPAACRDATRAACLAPSMGLRPLTDQRALTARQREVARLAATAMTSRAIADGLYVSPRTVDNHLRDIYRRLGISGRDELADVIA